MGCFKSFAFTKSEAVSLFVFLPVVLVSPSVALGKVLHLSNLCISICKMEISQCPPPWVDVRDRKTNARHQLLSVFISVHGSGLYVSLAVAETLT